MSKFKAGDKVFWEDDFGEQFHHIVSQVTGEQQVWFQDGGWMREDEVFFVNPDQIELAGMPEVPTDSRYECDIRPGRDSIHLDAETNESTIRVFIEQAGETAIVALTPETALDLSADLMRMALKMKRELDA